MSICNANGYAYVLDKSSGLWIIDYTGDDSYPPIIGDNQTGDDTWRNIDPGAIYDVDFADIGGSKLDYAQYTVYSGPAMSGSQILTWTDIATNIDALTYTASWSVNFNALPQGRNYVSVRAFDKDGNASAVATDVFYVSKDTIAPSIIDNEPGDDTWHGTDPGPAFDIDFSDANSQLKNIYYIARTGPNMTGTALFNWATAAQDINAASYTTPMSVSFASLTQGMNYISYKAEDYAGNISAVATDAFHVKKDTVEPTTSDDWTDNWTASSSVNISLTASDGTGSGIYSTYVCMDTANTCIPAATGTNVAVPCPSGSACTQYVRYKSADTVYNEEPVKSKRVRQDLLAPVAGSVTATNTATLEYVGKTFDMKASFADPDSGVASCSYCISSDGTCDTEWKSGIYTSATSLCFASSTTCTNGQTLKLDMRATDATGNTANATGTTRICDTTPPSSTFNSPAASEYMHGNFPIDISDSDSASGLLKCEYMVENLTSIWNITRTWTQRTCNSTTSATILVRPSGECYNNGPDTCRVTIRATDMTGNTSATTTRYFTVLMDGTPPTKIAAVNDGPGSDIDFSSSTVQLAANWSAATDTETGVSRYLYAIGISAGDTSILGWTDNGTATFMTKSGLSLTSGTKYYVSVKAENGSGITSLVTSSDGVTVDDTAPDEVSNMSATGSDARIDLSWTNPSNADYAGTRIVRKTGGYPANTGDGTVVYNATGTAYADIGLTNGTAYYYTAIAYDAAGNFSSGTDSGARAAMTPSSNGLVIHQGWNQIGISKQSATLNPATVFGTSKYAIVTYDGGMKFATGTLPINLKFAGGYWVYSENELGQIDPGGTEYTSANYDIPLVQGWNMFSSPYEEMIGWDAAHAALTCGGAPGALPSVFHFENDNYIIVAPGAGLSISPWKAYWIQLTQECSLKITK